MSARALTTATEAVASAFARLVDAPAQAPGKTRRWQSSAEALVAQWQGVADELSRITRMHDANAARIEAWQELPKGSAAFVAEARELAGVVDVEIGRLRAVQHRLERTKRETPDVVEAAPHLQVLHDEIARWLKDAEADKENLLLAGRSVIARDAGPGRAAGIVEIPLDVAVERALAEAYARREPRDDALRALGFLDQAARAKLLAEVDDELARQKSLTERVDAALQAARDAGVPAPPELRAAADRLRAWGIDLAHARGRLAKRAG